MVATWNVSPFFGATDFLPFSSLHLFPSFSSSRSSEDVKLHGFIVGHLAGPIASNGPERESSTPAFRFFSASTQTSAMVQGNTL
jgi:hypothetical protein